MRLFGLGLRPGGALFNGGRNVDVLIYSLLRDDPRPWRTSDQLG